MIFPQDSLLRLRAGTPEDEDLRLLSFLGLIAGPGEDLTSFCQRCTLSLCASEHSPPIAEEHGWDQLTLSEMDPALQRTEDIFGIRPSWVPVYVAEHGLARHMLACTWIDQDVPYVQLAHRFSKERWLGYDRAHVLAHELIHAARVAFDESSEELYAYQAETRGWRRLLGPWLLHDRAARLFLLSLCVPIVAPLLAFFMDFLEPWVLSASWIPPVALGSLLGWMGVRRKHTWKRCCAKLSSVVGGHIQAQSLTLHLTDDEVKRLAGGPEALAAMANSTEPRWLQIKARFLTQN
ncbi:MAG: hypothetical protein KDK78_08615 [Chlamydiia bacterium]|nr:hypothetical protein [Chlamydiia bacterium]